MGVVKQSLFCFLFFCCSHYSLSQVFLTPNHFDKKGQRHGRWKEYADSSKKRCVSKGRYRRDNKAGKWKYYTAQGKLERREKYKNNGTLIAITYFHPNGKVSSYGMAELVIEADLLHYYWYGEWKYFDETGVYQKSKIFLLGKEIKTTYPENNAKSQ